MSADPTESTTCGGGGKDECSHRPGTLSPSPFSPWGSRKNTDGHSSGSGNGRQYFVGADHSQPPPSGGGQEQGRSSDPSGRRGDGGHVSGLYDESHEGNGPQ